MNWDSISAFADIIAAIAVIISLIYLAVQVKQSNQQAEASAQSDWMTSWNEAIQGWISDEATVEVFRHGFSNFGALPETQKAIFQQKLAAVTNQWILAAQLHDSGQFPSTLFDTVTDLLVSVYSTPGGLELLEITAPGFPRGNELLQLARNKKGRIPPFTALFPWWSTETNHESHTKEKSAEHGGAGNPDKPDSRP